MNITEHQRPGVYSVYDASSAVSGRAGGRAAALAAVNTVGEAGKVVALTSRDQAVAAFGTEGSLTRLACLLLENGAARVYAAAVAGEEDYPAAFRALERVADVSVVVCDSSALAVQQALRDSVKRASESRRERLAVVFGGAEETVQALTDRGAALNCERVVLAAPGTAEAAAAVAGAIAGEPDPAVPLGGVELKGLAPLEAEWSDEEVDALILGGVTPLETRAGTVSIVRAVTTRTLTGEAKDSTWRELTAVRVVDHVIPGLRDALGARFRRAKNTPQGREAIRSQVIVELERSRADEIITGYDGVTVTAVEDNPTVCLVEFRFTVAHGLNQIWLSAHITV